MQGSGRDFCFTPDNCQPEFGFCESDMTPVGNDTSRDPRPLLGQVSYDVEISHCVRPLSLALTFDDGPFHNTTGQLLDLLWDWQAKATFFVSGNNKGKGEIDTTSPFPDLLRRMIAEGHQVASHGWSHLNLSSLNSTERRSEMFKNERAIANIIGQYPTYMRAPYDDCTVQSGCPADVRALGYHRILYDFDSRDYQHVDDMQNAETLATEFFRKTNKSGNALVLQHDIIPASAVNLTRHILNIVHNYGWKGETPDLICIRLADGGQ